MRRAYFGLAAIAVLIQTACAAPQAKVAEVNPARFLYVWAGSGNDSTDGMNVMTVIDADPASPNYGDVVSALTVDSSGRMPHHMEFTLPKNNAIFANDFHGDKSYLIGYENPTAPRLVAKTMAVPAGHQVHSFERLANGHVVATVQFGDASVEGKPGMLAEFDENGKFLKSGSARDSAFPGAKIRTYALAALPAIDRIVTTSSPMGNEATAHVVQVWRLSDLHLLKTLAVPVVPGDSSHKYPFEVRALPDGKSAMVNTYYCGFFKLSDVENDPKIEKVLSLPLPQNIGCSVPVVSGKFMVMPIAYAHRFATIDMSDPAHPKEIASFPTDSTFFPHWAAADPGSDRLVFSDQGDGPPRVMVAHLDPTTGKLSWDEKFRDKGATSPGVSYHRPRWPNGLTGMLMPHGALFVP